MIPRIEDIEGLPVVRREYDVPVAVMKNKYSEAVLKIPIIGEAHMDPQFTPYKHYHIDGRFAHSNPICAIGKGRTNNAVFIDADYKDWQFVGTERRVFVCKHKLGGIEFPKSESWKSFYNDYLGKKCKGKKCPHWGTEMQEHKDGTLECPMHGLHARNGKIVIPDHLKSLLIDHA